MIRIIFALLFGSLASFAALAQNPYVGTYKLLSLNAVYDDGLKEQPYGASPQGYIIITPTRYLWFYTSAERKAGTTPEAKAALLDTLSGGSATYTLKGNTFTLTFDTAWTEAWKGTKQDRIWTPKGKNAISETPPVPSARRPGTKVVIRTELEKVD